MNTLYYGDNLQILKDFIPNESIDLIYLDPPFNSKADYNILFKEINGSQSKAQITAFEDTWHWTNESEKTYDEIIQHAPANVIKMMESFRQFIGHNDVMAYLTMMCIRILELHRVLKNTGSIFLHCDPTASHYLKILMDAIFGTVNFQNEIIWHYRRWSAATNRFQRIHDVILFFSKGTSHKFNMLYEDYTKGTLKRWKGIKRKTKVLADGSLYQEEDPEGIKGANMGDVWPISIINSQAKERLGYPTQKPEALLERIIQTGSDEDDVVLDPFCGCGTTISVAQKLGRKWIGIDITHLATNLIKFRLKNQFGLLQGKDYKVIGEPKDLTGAKELAQQNRYEFQYWAISFFNAKPYGDKKKGADTGIDGYIYFQDFIAKEPKLEIIIIQVKSGKVDVKDIRDLCHVIDREKAVMGIFITLEEPTKPMEKEAVIKGLYKPNYLLKKFPRIQILTIEQLFKGIRPDIPMFEIPYKKAEKFSDQLDILK